MTATVTAVGGLCLHLMGATYNAEYYRRWGVDAAFFPLMTDATLALGYEAFVNGMATGALSLYREYRPWLYGYGAFLAFVLLVAVWIGLRQERNRPVWVPDVRWRRAGSLAVPVVAAFAIPAVVLPYAALAGVLALALPMFAAEHYARQQVQSRLQAFDAGCANTTANFRCTTVTQGGRELVSGFLIGASSTHIAVYDPTESRVVTMERASLMLSVPTLERVGTKTP